MKIEQIYKEHQQNVFGYVINRVKNFHDAEEVTADIFLKVNKYLHTFDETKSALSTWIITISNIVIIDYFRTNHQHYYSAVSDFVDSEGNETYQFETPKSNYADSKIIADEKMLRINKAFETLKPQYKEIGILHFIKELKYGEIAKELNIPLGTVKGMISRVRSKLQKELKPLQMA